MSFVRSTKKAVQSRTIEQLAYSVDMLKENIVQLDMYLYFIESVLINKKLVTKEELDEISKTVRGMRAEDGAPPAVPVKEIV